MKKIIFAFAFVALGFFIFKRNSKVSVTQQASVEEKAAEPKAKKKLKLNAAAKKAVRATSTVAAAPRIDVSSTLRKYTTSGAWKMQYDRSGRPSKMTGGKLRDVMSDGPASAEFLKDLQTSLGFKKPATFSRSEVTKEDIKIVDQSQFGQMPDGRILPIYDSSIRFMGDAQGNAFLVQNSLQPVDNIAKSTTDEKGAIAIAESHLRSLGADSSATYEIAKKQGHAIYAQSSPQQEVITVYSRSPAGDHIIVVGAATGTIISDELDGIE